MECHPRLAQPTLFQPRLSQRILTRIAMRTAVVWAATILFLCAAAFANAQNNPAAQDMATQVTTAQDPPSRVARLAQIQGQVSVEPSGVDQWTQAGDNYPLTTGDRLYADRDSRVEVQMEQAAVRVWQLTDLSVTNLTDTITQLGVSQGSVHVNTTGMVPGSTVEVDTPNGAITVVQPGDFRVDCYTTDGGTVVSVYSGEVQISGPDFSQTLASGQSVRLLGVGPIVATPLALPGEDAFDAWDQQRDSQMASSQASQYVNPDTVGSSDLDQYGTWGNAPDYGPVWYPTGVPAGWVPYSTGSWVWVSPWGWTWVDTYPWGFAPFHYGRWAHVGARWGWVPGPYAVAPVYSPALVGFVGGVGFSVGGVGLSAWFPLGPGEPYYPWYPCSPRYFTQVNVTNIHRVTIDRNNYYSYYHNQENFNRIRYSNRDIGTIAVRGNEFASGRALSPGVVIRPSAQQLAHAQIIPHPFVNPTRGAIVPHPVTSVPASVDRPSLLTTHGQLRPAPGGHGNIIPARPSPTPRPATANPTSPHNNIAPLNSQNLERSAQPNRQPAPAASQPARGVPGFPLISRTPPPTPRPTFEQRQPAYQNDPGRPLGPHQENNLMQGRPAGPARTPEFPPHPAWAPRSARSAPPAEMRSAPAQRAGAPRH